MAADGRGHLTYRPQRQRGHHLPGLPGARVSDDLKYAVVAGAVAGGGLTVIANAPNPAGQSILASCFGGEGISALRLFVWALFPTIIMGAAFMLLR